MLGLQLKLTPAQVRCLMALVYCERIPIRMRDGSIHAGLPFELADMVHFLNTVSALERRSLVYHDGESFKVTEEGEAVAKLIYKNAKAITDLVESQKQSEVIV